MEQTEQLPPRTQARRSHLAAIEQVTETLLAWIAGAGSFEAYVGACRAESAAWAAYMDSIKEGSKGK